METEITVALEGHAHRVLEDTRTVSLRDTPVPLSSLSYYSHQSIDGSVMETLMPMAPRTPDRGRTTWASVLTSSGFRRTSTRRRSAVPPLIPHLRGVRTFAEPCCGDGELVRHLEALGLRCVYAGDISTGQDALARSSYGDPDAIITNPPYTRTLMHRLIAHFQKIAPTWLLLDSTGRRPGRLHRSLLLGHRAIGRLKWIEDSKGSRHGQPRLVPIRFRA